MTARGDFIGVWSDVPEMRRTEREPCSVVAQYRSLVEKKMGELRYDPDLLELNRCKLFLTDKYREARRLAPYEATCLEEMWDAAYCVVEYLVLRADAIPLQLPPLPPPPPPPSFEEMQTQYKAMKRERARQADARTVHWHPLELADDTVALNEPGDPSV